MYAKNKKEEMSSAMKKLLLLLAFGLCAVLAAENDPFAWRTEVKDGKREKIKQKRDFFRPRT